MMKVIKITALVQAEYPELCKELELMQEIPCDHQAGQSWICQNGQIPQGFCIHAWSALYPYILALANGASTFFDGWMKKEGTALISCPDGFRPMSFLLEVLPDDLVNKACKH